jgi:FkbM family methyltransferase
MNYVLANDNTRVEIPNDLAVTEYLKKYNVANEVVFRQLNEERMFQPLFDSAEDFTVIDLGANIGLFSLYAQGKAKRVIAVEPTPNTFSILEKITAGNPKIELLKGAASDHDGDTSFFITYEPTINSLMSKEGEEVAVKCYTIKSILDQFNVDYAEFVKCDIEGGEVLAITDETIRAVADRIGFWMIEIHQTDGHHLANGGHAGVPWPGNLEANRQQIVRVLERHGYTTECIEHDQLLAWK